MRRGLKRELFADVLRERRDALRVPGRVPVLRLEREDQRLDRLLLRRLQLEVAGEGRSGDRRSARRTAGRPRRRGRGTPSRPPTPAEKTDSAPIEHKELRAARAYRSPRCIATGTLSRGRSERGSRQPRPALRQRGARVAERLGCGAIAQNTTEPARSARARRREALNDDLAQSRLRTCVKSIARKHSRRAPDLDRDDPARNTTIAAMRIIVLPLRPMAASTSTSKFVAASREHAEHSNAQRSDPSYNERVDATAARASETTSAARRQRTTAAVSGGRLAFRHVRLAEVGEGKASTIERAVLLLPA